MSEPSRESSAPKSVAAEPAAGETAVDKAGEEEALLPESACVRFPCENCGAQTRWDPDVDALLCEHCGHRKDVPRAEGTILERPLDEAGAAARGLGLEVRVARCGTCGAQVSFDTAATAESCVYCGSSNVLVQEANRNAIRPESLVPLDVSRAAVEESLRRWLRGLWFRPSALKRVRSFDAVGVYVPFWSFDCRVHSDWSADAGYYYYVTETYWTTVNGRRVMRTRQVRKVRWVPAWGARDDAFDDLLIHASASQPLNLVRKLGDFDTKGLLPYKPEYLAGWRAEEYQVDLEGGWAAAIERIKDIQTARCARDVPGDTHRFLRVQNRIADTRWKHVLLPIWSATYRFNRKTYTVLVHGQTGKVAGEAPLSWIKIVSFSVAVLVVVVLAMIVLAVLTN